MCGTVETVLNFSDGVIVLTGPARSGKTAAALELYSRYTDPAGRPGCLLIVPNAPAVTQMRSALLERSKNHVLIAPAITTFAGLAGRILSASGKSPTALSPVRRLLLLEAIIADLHAAGALKALGPLVGAPGLTGVLDAAIAELKRAAVEPDALAAAIDRRSKRDADLVAVYRRYQEHLLSTGRFDVEGQMWLARDVLADGHRLQTCATLGYENIAAVAVDGFTDFTPTQLDMLALLSRRAEKVLITLPLAGDSCRDRLWFWTARTLERIRKAVPDARVVAAAEAPGLFGSLFDLPGGDKPSHPQGTGSNGWASGRSCQGATGSGDSGFSITVLEAPDIESEVRAVARSVKADLVHGDDSVAVIARNLETYAEPIERIFAAHGIGVASTPAPLDTCGPVRYVLRLMSLPGDYEFHDVLAVIKNSYFRPSALGDFDAATVATAEMGIRTANVLGGRDSYAKAFARLGWHGQVEDLAVADDTTAKRCLTVPPTDTLAGAAGMLEALLDRLDRLNSATGISEYVEALRGLIDGLEVSDAARNQDDDSLVAADLRALVAMEELLDELALAELPCNLPILPPAEMIARAASVAVCPPARCEAMVAVLDVLDARAVRFERVYLLGVNEKVFPQLSADRCFINEADRAAWAGRGVALDRRSDLIGREMLLFYLAATRANEALTVSYLFSDASEAPSVFVDELISAAGREGLPVARKRIGPGQFVPPYEEIACPADAFGAAILAAFDDQVAVVRRRHGQASAALQLDRATQSVHPTAAGLLGWVAKNRSQTLRRVSFGLTAVHRRWARGQPDAFDGRIDSPDLLKMLAERFPDKWIFSASELNIYAACGWQFFARYLLGLVPLVEPAAPLTPADRGVFCHAVLWRVMTTLARRTGRPVNLAGIEPDDLNAVLAEAVEYERKRLADRAIYSQLWEAQTRHWQRILADYLTDQRDESAEKDARSLYFELGFGLGGHPGDAIDSASRVEPVEISAGQYTIRLRGKIDRVDEIDAAGAPALLAVDYKTGRIPAGKEILEGLDLQLSLYAAALGAMFETQCAGGAYHDLRDRKHRYFATFKMPRVRGGDRLDYNEAFAAAMETVGRHVQSMREGGFDALPARQCPPWCPYRQICHYWPQRARRKEGGDE